MKVKRPSRGVVWSHLKAGESFGKPLAEWAHISPKYPAGIKDSDLRIAAPAIQREVALFWFHSNFEPYDLSNHGVPWYGYGSGAIGTQPSGTGPIGGGGVGPIAAAPLNASNLLRQEFDQVLGMELIDTLGEALGARWMWKADSPMPPVDPGSLTDRALRDALSPILNEFLERLRQLPVDAEHGGIGHNQPPEPITAEEKKEVVEAVTEITSVVEGPDDLNVKWLRVAWDGVLEKLKKFGVWLLDRSNDFFTGFAQEGGKAIGQQLPWIILAAIGVFGLGMHANHIIEILLSRAQ
jgi:hypothetical protein